MTAFDTDLLSDILRGVEKYRDRYSALPVAERSVTVVTCEEVYRGRLNAIRKADGAGRVAELLTAYEELRTTVRQFGSLVVLPYTPAAHALFLAWRAAKIRVGSGDLRIAAIAVAHDIELVTRNRRDFDQVPGLNLTVWN